MLHLFQKKIIKDETSVIFCIESGEIISAIVKFETGKLPHVLFVRRMSIPVHEELDISHLVPRMLVVLKRSAELIMQEGLVHIQTMKEHINLKYTHVFLGVPWYLSKTTTQVFSDTTPFVLTPEMLEQQSEKLFDQVLVNGIHIEKKVVSIKANGYIIKDPIGRKVSSLEYKGFVSVVEEDLYKQLTETISIFLPNFEIFVHTYSLSTFSVMSEYIKERDYILVLPEAHVIEMIHISNSSIESSVSVPYGKHYILELMMKRFDCSKTESYSILKLYRTNGLTDQKKSELLKLFAEAQHVFKELLGQAFQHLNKNILLPNTVIFADNGFETHLLAKWFLSEEYINQTFTTDGFKGLFFTHKDLEQFVTYHETVHNSSLETVLATSVLYIQML